MKKHLIPFIIVVVILIIPMAILYLLNNGNPYAKYMANMYIPRHLEEKGYKEEIKTAHYVEPKNLMNKDFYHGQYMVVFKDEPSITYYYGVTKEGKKVYQFCEKDSTSPSLDEYTTTKHSEQNCVNSFENR